MRKILDTNGMAKELGMSPATVVDLAAGDYIPVLEASGGRLWFEARKVEKILARRLAAMALFLKALERDRPLIEQMIREAELKGSA